MTNSKGFTLLEILIAVALMSIVMLVVITVILSAQKFCSTINFEIALNRQAVMAVKTAFQDFEYAAAEQIYPLSPVDSPYLEFKKINDISADGVIVWGPKIRWEWRKRDNQETGEIVRTQYAADDKSLTESKIVVRYVPTTDTDTKLHGISFTKDGQILHIAITLRRHDNKGYVVRVHHKIALRLQ